MHQNILNLVSLLNPDAHAHRVHARLDKHALVLVSRHRHGRQHDLGRAPRLNLGDIVPFGDLRGEVGEAEGGGEGAAHALEVGAERLGLLVFFFSDLAVSPELSEIQACR